MNTSGIRAVMQPDKLRQLITPTLTRRKTSRSLTNSFTDLAAQLSRVPPKQHSSLVDLNALDTDDEEYIVYNDEGSSISDLL